MVETIDMSEKVRDKCDIEVAVPPSLPHTFTAAREPDALPPVIFFEHITVQKQGKGEAEDKL